MRTIDIEAGLAGFFAQDHRDCDSRWVDVEEFLDNGDMEMAAEVWKRYEKCMRRHLEMEEDILFPAFDARSGNAVGGPTADMRMEHQKIRGMLEEIGEAIEAGQAEQALDRGDTLLMLVQRHNIKEESMLYPMAENMLAGEWAALAEHLEKYWVE